MKRFLPIVLVVLVFLLSLATCQMKSDETETTSTPSSTPSLEPTDVIDEVTEPVETPYDGPTNPLTGLPVVEDISMYRPYAIMINNLKKAQPQQGISQADIIFEALVEGGITRMMAVYQDVSHVGVIGSVRSSRHYFLDLAQGLDAVYIHAGGSALAYDAIYSRNITHLDGVNGGKQDIFYRDAARRASMGYEHSLMTSGELISEYVPQYNFETEHKDGYVLNMSFIDDGTPQNGQEANSVIVHFSSGKSTTFDFSREEGRYYVSQYGSAYADGNDDIQLSFTNVLVLYAKVYQISGDTAGRLETILTGSGSGYFFCGGKYIEISWSKENHASPFVFTDSNGNALTFSRGKTYVNIVSKNNEVDIT